MRIVHESPLGLLAAKDGGDGDGRGGKESPIRKRSYPHICIPSDSLRSVLSRAVKKRSTAEEDTVLPWSGRRVDYESRAGGDNDDDDYYGDDRYGISTTDLRRPRRR